MDVRVIDGAVGRRRCCTYGLSVGLRVTVLDSMAVASIGGVAPYTYGPDDGAVVEPMPYT